LSPNEFPGSIELPYGEAQATEGPFQSPLKSGCGEERRRQDRQRYRLPLPAAIDTLRQI